MRKLVLVGLVLLLLAAASFAAVSYSKMKQQAAAAKPAAVIQRTTQSGGTSDVQSVGVSPGAPAHRIDTNEDEDAAGKGGTSPDNPNLHK